MTEVTAGLNTNWFFLFFLNFQFILIAKQLYKIEQSYRTKMPAGEKAPMKVKS